MRVGSVSSLGLNLVNLAPTTCKELRLPVLRSEKYSLDDGSTVRLTPAKIFCWSLIHFVMTEVLLDSAQVAKMSACDL